MTTSVKLQKDQWTLISQSSCIYSVEGENVSCLVTESNDLPTDLPDGNKPSTIAYRTIEGREVYEFAKVGDTKLWGFATFNGATVIVDSREGAEISQAARISAVTAFGEMKVAGFDLIAAWLFPYNINSELIIATTENGGTVDQVGSFARLQTSTASNGRAKIETRKAVRYQTGIGGLVRFTRIFHAPTANSLQIQGLGDDNDGFFFGYQGEAFGVFRRNGGVDNFTARADWSEQGAPIIDDLDPAQLNVYQIQFQWLGGGEIRFYVEDPEIGGFTLVHRITPANGATDVTIQNPSLPLMAEVRNLGNTTNLEGQTPSAAAGLEGDSTNRALQIVRGVSGAKPVDTTTLAILSIQNPGTYQGQTNRLTIRLTLLSIGVAATNTGRRATVQIRRGVMLGGTPAFSPVDADATPAELDTASTTATGGTTLASFTVIGQTSISQNIDPIEISIRPGEILTVTAVGSQAIEEVAVGVTFDSEA